jgi:hypothetical protein
VRAAGDQKRRASFLGSALLKEPISGRAVLLVLFGLAALSTLLRIAVVSRVHAPIVFSDELSYSKLAQSIGQTGHLALFNDRGLSYSPLYPLVLSPIYALGASAPTAYSLIKIVNALLISLSIFPTYKIARFVLPRRFSLLVAALSALAPALSYSSFVMSENLAYPLCLVGVWAMIAAARAPGLRSDAIVLASIVAATAARIQLIVLFPVALTAFVLAPVLDRESDETAMRSLVRALREHRLFFGAVVAVVLVAGLAGLAGRGVLSLGGSYAAVADRGLPNVGHFLKLLVEHVAGVEFAVGVVPFVGALVVAYAFARSRGRRPHIAFATVSVSLTTWLLLETAFQAAQFDSGPGANIPRIHERFLVYVTPLFLVALVAAWRAAEGRTPFRAYVGAAAVAALLPSVVPYGTVINNTIGVDTFGLQPLAHLHRGNLVAYSHATLAAVWLAATLGLLYTQVRKRLRSVVMLALIPFIAILIFETDRTQGSSSYARSLLPKHVDWVDRAHPAGDVILITARRPTAELQTAFSNLSISRLYYVCRLAFGGEFGELPVTIDNSGRLRDPVGYLTAPYVVAPVSLHLRGRVVARNRKREVLVAPPEGRVSVTPATGDALRCR